jgi:iron(III) transport system ATP-binding protein
VDKRVGVTNLTKFFDSPEGPVAALRGIDFQIAAGEFYTLLGPSGCGKSTTLRCIAGLESPNDGEITIGEETVSAGGRSTPANLRPIGMVFQSYAIWPHMTVFNNVAFPLKQARSRVPRAERRARVMEALALVKMDELADRPSPYLSGGQQQRVALARALVSKPDVLLLDEPLSNLDAKLREDLRHEIKLLTKALGITTLYVTHDQLEALAMSDRIAVMLDGAILQEGGPRDIYLRPENDFVARFVGQVNFFKGKVIEAPAQGLGAVDTGAGRINCTIPAGVKVGAAVSVAVRPESLTTRAANGGGGVFTGNILRGRVVLAVFLGDSIDCQVEVQGHTVRAKVEQTSKISEGDEVSLEFDAGACVVFEV